MVCLWPGTGCLCQGAYGIVDDCRDRYGEMVRVGKDGVLGMAKEQDVLNRWRLVLGKYAKEQIPFSGEQDGLTEMEQVLDYLYSREYGEEQDIRRERGGGSENSRLTVPHWIAKMKKLFPKHTVEIMERHALERYGMTELLTDPEVLRKLEPNKELLKTILGLKHMMKGEVLFHGRMKKYNMWRIIICVDESGSMLDSVIHSAVMAGIFAKLPMLDTRLVIFDTNVVDLSGYVEDPVETLMSIQLGGGTNIAGALSYCEKLIDFPYRTMVVLVSDLYEGGGYQNLYRVSRDIIESGAKLIALTALDMEANPGYDRRAAAELASLGASVGAMTPEELAEFIGKSIG